MRSLLIGNIIIKSTLKNGGLLECNKIQTRKIKKLKTYVEIRAATQSHWIKGRRKACGCERRPEPTMWRITI
jgi:hypothetical protein